MFDIDNIDLEVDQLRLVEFDNLPTVYKKTVQHTLEEADFALGLKCPL